MDVFSVYFRCLSKKMLTEGDEMGYNGKKGGYLLFDMMYIYNKHLYIIKERMLILN
jgi:hypothetical protein